jgi:uncharacterized protein (DUF111 family)
MPVMKVEKIGYGMGKKDFERANCVRVMLGETGDDTDKIVELSCNVDDMTGESIGYAMEKLFDGGALDVFTVPVNMKKSRPGILITVLCRPETREQIVRLIFKHTTTLGVRETVCSRYVLDRKVEEMETPVGKIRKKTSSGYGVQRSKFEYDDVAAAADKKGIGLDEIRDIIR